MLTCVRARPIAGPSPPARRGRFTASAGGARRPSVNGLAWGAGGRLLAAAGDEAVTLWAAASGSGLARFAVDGYARHLAWAPSGELVAASLGGDRIGLWDARAALTSGR